MLRSICRDFGLPRHRTVLSWVAKRPDLCRRYDLARELAVHTVGDDASDVADGIWRRSSPTASEDARRCRRRVVVTEIAHQSTRARRAFAAIQVMRNSTARVPPRGSRLSACRTWASASLNGGFITTERQPDIDVVTGSRHLSRSRARDLLHGHGGRSLPRAQPGGAL